MGNVSETEMKNGAKGDRAEKVASWFFRLNGFLSIPGFIVHPDELRRYPRTEADFMAVRLPFSAEKLGEHYMKDASFISEVSKSNQVLFILVEVTSSPTVKINDTWKNSYRENMQRTIRRLGFVETEMRINVIADEMYSNMRWEDEKYVLQYIAIGGKVNDGLQRTYKRLLQITWDEIGDFLYNRFYAFPVKLPSGDSVHRQWPNFGRQYGNCFREIHSKEESVKAINNYIYYGKCSVHI